MVLISLIFIGHLLYVRHYFISKMIILGKITYYFYSLKFTYLCK